VIFLKELAFIGLCVVVGIAIAILRELGKFIQRVVVGKYKLKCICKHEFEPYMK
jgi:hypothetical protein